MTNVARGWNEFEEWEREEWRKRAGAQLVPVRRSGNPEADGRARTRSLRGEEFYVKINRVLAVCGYAPRRLPPPLPEFGSNPVEAVLRIGCVKGKYTFKLGVRESAANDIMVFGSPPRRERRRLGGRANQVMIME